MIVGMPDTEDHPIKPNPSYWTDIAGAALLLNRSRPTVYEMIERGVLTRYEIGCHALLWVPEVKNVAAAIRVLRAHR